MSAEPLDILAFIADDRFGVTYKPRWNVVTGSMAASILLQQIVFRWAHSGRRPFYKFARSCDHRLYRAGDSWEEELAMKRREFENARAALAVRTRGDVSPDALVSYWVDAQRVTWYALNEAVFLQRFAVLYPQSGAAVQLPLPSASVEPMDETYIESNGRNVHQPPAGLMDETSISSDAPNVHQPMDETSIASDGRNVHPLYSENEITQQRSPKTATAPAAAPAPAAAAADPLAPVLDWIGFGDVLNPQERQALDVATLLAWAYTIKLKQAERRAGVYNPVGLARSLWRQGNQPRADLLRLARGWLLLDDDGRARLLGRLEWCIDYGADPGAPLDDEFPDIPLTTAAQVYRAAARALAPPALSPAEPVCPPDQSPAALQSRANGHRSVPQTDPADVSSLWKDVLAELEMQMPKATYTAWLDSSAATLDGDDLTIHVRNASAVAWLRERLHPVVQRAVDYTAGRPLAIRYAVGLPAPEAVR